MGLNGKRLSGNLALVDGADADVTSNKCLQFGNTVSAALLHGAGTSTTQLVCTSAKNFLGYWVSSSHTSGDVRGIYLRLYLSGAGTSGEAGRFFTTVSGTGTAHGAHISLNFSGSGAITGLGVASRNTLHIPNSALAAGGTYAATQPEIWSDGASSDPAAITELSFIRCVMGGNATGIGRVDDKAYLLVLDGVTEGAGNMVVASATEANYASAARCKINGVDKWLMFASASG